MNHYQPSFFDEAERYIKLDKLNDPLVELKRHIDFEMFRPKLEELLRKPKQSPAGRKPLDVVFMFKVLVLQRLYNMSDEQIEFQITDRCSFCRFLGIPLGGKAPDFTTVWRFREALADAGGARELFDLFTAHLEQHGLIANHGCIVDASFVEVPKQRNTKEENKLIKKGITPEGWAENPRKLCQKDLDARWTKKNNVSYYGYKDHVKADAASKLITDYKVTSAEVHDSQPLFDLVGEDCKGEPLFADSAYRSAEIERKLAEMEIPSFIHEKGTRNRPLDEFAKMANTIKSSIRCLVEHICECRCARYGFIENSMGGPELRYIGFKRIETGVGLSNLVYNMKRSIQLTRPAKASSM